MDSIHAYTLADADECLQRDGFIVSAIHTIERDGAQVISMVAGLQDGKIELWPDENIIVLPAPLQRHQPFLRQVFALFEVVGATWSSEVWMFPPSSAQADMDAYLAGQGPSPSRHPERHEAAIICSLWPQGEYLNLSICRVVRGDGVSRLEGWSAGEFDGSFRKTSEAPLIRGGQIPSFLTSWLEWCLPTSEDDEPARGRHRKE